MANPESYHLLIPDPTQPTNQGVTYYTRQILSYNEKYMTNTLNQALVADIQKYKPTIVYFVNPTEVIDVSQKYGIYPPSSSNGLIIFLFIVIIVGLLIYGLFCRNTSNR